MIGLVPKILVDMVLENADKATLREIFKQSRIEEDRVFHMNEYYEDTEWQRLFKSTLSVMHISESKVCEFYADCFCRFATARFPVWFGKAKNAHEFLCLQPIIHNGFASGLVDGITMPPT